MKNLLIIFLLLSGISCDEPGETYTVRILSVEVLAGNPSNYCVYRVECLDCPPKRIPRHNFVDNCGKYAVGAEFSIEMAPMN